MQQRKGFDLCDALFGMQPRANTSLSHVSNEGSDMLSEILPKQGVRLTRERLPMRRARVDPIWGGRSVQLSSFTSFSRPFPLLPPQTPPPGLRLRSWRTINCEVNSIYNFSIDSKRPRRVHTGGVSLSHSRRKKLGSI